MKDHEFENAPDLGKALDRAARKADGRVIEIDIEKYQSYLDDPALSDDQKEQIVHALWALIVSFVEFGFGVHPVQQACGQLENEFDPAAKPDSDVVNSEDTKLSEAFNEDLEQI